MNYLIIENNKLQKYNATSKARNDINTILLSDGFKELPLNTSYKRFNNKFLKVFQIPYMFKNRIVWNNIIRKINESNILIQYPALDSVIGFDKVLKKLSEKNNVILLIHDLDSLRGNKKNILRKEDEKNLNAASYIICHNDSMKKEIIKMGVNRDKIVSLKLFDYVYDKISFKNRKRSNEVIIAGNLSPDKVKYIQYLDCIDNIIFNLYGVGYVEKNASNINYKGKFTPEELLNNLDGSFGLIWDGESIEGCSGDMGNYLKYNNPHKLSLYMAAGIPVIAWKKAAISKFVLDNNVGIVVDSLEDINSEIDKLSEKDYQRMIDNCKNISKKIKDGFYIKSAIEKIIK